jgi:hypothetical protein
MSTAYVWTAHEDLLGVVESGFGHAQSGFVQSGFVQSGFV